MIVKLLKISGPHVLLLAFGVEGCDFPRINGCTDWCHYLCNISSVILHPWEYEVLTGYQHCPKIFYGPCVPFRNCSFGVTNVVKKELSF